MLLLHVGILHRNMNWRPFDFWIATILRRNRNPTIRRNKLNKNRTHENMKKLLASLALTAVAANAATITYTNVVSGYTDFIADVHIPQFNPQLGTLRSIVAQAQIIEKRTIGFENQSSAIQSGAANIQNSIRFTVQDSIDNVYNSSVSLRKTFYAYDGVTDYAGTSGYTFPSNATNAIALSVTNSASFSGYSVIPVRVSVVGTSSWSFSGGSYASKSSDFVEVRILVQYTFDPCLFVMVNENRKLRRVS